MSSPPSSKRPDDSSTLIEPPASRVSAASTESSIAKAALSSFTASPRRGPTVRKFGTRSKVKTLESSVPYSSRSTLKFILDDVLWRHRRIGGQEHEGARQGLANFDTGLGARGATERGQSPCHGHRHFEIDVAALGIANGPVGQVDRVTFVDVEQLGVETFGDEWTERREEQGQSLEYFEQRRLRRQGVRSRLVGVGSPEASTRAPHVPVGEIVDQLSERIGAARGS